MTRAKFVTGALSFGLSLVLVGKPPPKKGRTYGAGSYGTGTYGGT